MMLWGNHRESQGAHSLQEHLIRPLPRHDGHDEVGTCRTKGMPSVERAVQERKPFMVQ